ncbi:MAG: DUF4410 domain-containing protein [Candidatus Entotheonellia bacterium]
MNNRTGNSAPGHLTLTFPCQSPEASSALRRTIATIVPCLFAMVVAAGCASTKVTDREELVTGQLPRPDHIWVYDFAATAADVPADSTLAGQYSAGATPQTAGQIAAGRQLGAQIAAQLVAQIRGMGLPAAQAVAGTTPRINDIVIRGYLLSVKEGSAAERVAIGFGSGASELRTAVEGYQMTAQGLRKLGSGTVDSGGSKAPGEALGVAGLIATGNPAGLIISTGMKVYGEESGSSKVEGRAKQTAEEIADVLKKRFEQQGWIQ